MGTLLEYTKSKNFEDGYAGYVLEDGSFIYVDEYHNEEDNPYKDLGLPEFSATHLEDVCVRIYKEPNQKQYDILEKIMDLYLKEYDYCKVELWEKPNEGHYFYKAFSTVDGACEFASCFEEVVGNWTGYDLVRIIKNNINNHYFTEGYPIPKKLYDIKDDKAYWPDDAEDWIWWGSEAKDVDDYAKSYKVKMSPKDFLDLTTIAGADKIKLGDDIGLSPAEKLDIDKLNKETYQPLFLQIAFRSPDVAKVTGHEGRHRAFALMDAGIKEVDVELRPDTYDTPYDKYHPFNPKKLRLVDQFNQHRCVVVENPLILSWKNHKAIRPSLSEGSNINLLYHGTTLNKAISILESNELKAYARNYYNLMVTKKPSVSFTRDLSFVKNMPLGEHPVIFVIDGNKLRERYKLIPVSDDKNTFGGPKKARYENYPKAEEVVEANIKNIKRYIIKILCNPSDVDAFRNFDDLPYEMFCDINGSYKSKLTESLLLEMNRNQLINKSKHSDNYKDMSKGRNRWERRNHSKIATHVDQYNKIDMNEFFKNDELKVGINVKGETADYVVTIRYAGALKEIENQIKLNNNTLEFKCVLIALQRVFNSGNVFVSCSCLHPDTKIKLLDGTSPTMKELKDRFDAGETLWAYSTDEHGDFKPGQIKNVWITKTTTDFIETTLDNGEKILTTPEHLFMLRDGTYIQAKDLKENDSLMPLYFSQVNGYETVKFNTEERGWHTTYKVVANELKQKEFAKNNSHVHMPSFKTEFDTVEEAVTFFKLNHKVKEVRTITLEDTPVYDLTVDTWENFLLDAGVIVHNCPDWRYRQAYHATKDGYNSGTPEIRASDITNPGDTKGAGCKHVNLVLGNVDWLMKICSVINNYIHYMKDHYERKYADLIFPKLFGLPYQKAVQLNLFDTDDTLSANPDEIKLSNKFGRDRTKFKSDIKINNMKNFGGVRKYPEDDPNQPKLDLGVTIDKANKKVER